MHDPVPERWEVQGGEQLPVSRGVQGRPLRDRDHEQQQVALTATHLRPPLQTRNMRRQEQVRVRTRMVRKTMLKELVTYHQLAKFNCNLL
jgi:hypothetical protein